ncbi:MAG TPA: hypothetical protein VMI10_10660 [Terriglobales bacterium]|nr:hypothetical protein [Terriglobales bacterium]
MAIANPVPSFPDKDILLKQYELQLDLYKQYLELVLKFNIFYYAVTGAILSFYFTNTSDVGLPRYLLLCFPVLLSFGFAVFFVWAASLVRFSRYEVINIARALGLQVFPEMRVLAMLLRLSGALYAVVALGLLAIICRTARH